MVEHLGIKFRFYINTLVGECGICRRHFEVSNAAGTERDRKVIVGIRKSGNTVILKIRDTG